jgi:hypothetical protein
MTITAQSSEQTKSRKPRADRGSKIAQMEAELQRLKKLEAAEKQREETKARERSRALQRREMKVQKAKEAQAIAELSALLKKHKLHLVPLHQWSANVDAIAKTLA